MRSFGDHDLSDRFVTRLSRLDPCVRCRGTDREEKEMKLEIERNFFPRLLVPIGRNRLLLPQYLRATKTWRADCIDAHLFRIFAAHEIVSRFSLKRFK